MYPFKTKFKLMMDNFMYHFKRWLPFIFMILLLLFFHALMFIRKNGFSFSENKVRNEEILSKKPDKIQAPDSLKRTENETKVVGEIQQDSLVKYDKDENHLFAGNIRGTYHIIVGSFTNTENAKLAARKYRNLGYKTNFISMAGRNGIKTELVSVNTLNNFEEAVRYLSEFNRKFDSTAWIYSDH